MALSLFETCVPAYLRALGNLAGILGKGAAFAAERGFDPSVLFEARLAPDMFPLCRQAQFVTDGIRGCIARLADVEAPVMPYTEKTFAELAARIQATAAFVNGVPEDRINAGETREFVVNVAGVETRFVGRDYLRSFALPNLYFHTTVAYAILRHNGVAVGKTDYLGPYG